MRFEFFNLRNLMQNFIKTVERNVIELLQDVSGKTEKTYLTASPELLFNEEGKLSYIALDRTTDVAHAKDFDDASGKIAQENIRENLPEVSCSLRTVIIDFNWK
jgi:hypothetical protein